MAKKSRKEIREERAEALNKTGGNGQDDWYIYKGIIPPNKIKKVKNKKPQK